MHGRGACVAGGHVWQGACVVGGVHGRGACMVGACMAGEHAWQGGMCGRRHVWHAHNCPPPTRSYEIRSMSGWYASFWNAYLFSSRNAKKQLVPCFILCWFWDNFFIFFVNITESGNLIEKKQFHVTN